MYQGIRYAQSVYIYYYRHTSKCSNCPICVKVDPGAGISYTSTVYLVRTDERDMEDKTLKTTAVSWMSINKKKSRQLLRGNVQ